MRIAFLQSTLFISFFCLFLMLLAFSYVFFGYIYCIYCVFFFAFRRRRHLVIRAVCRRFCFEAVFPFICIHFAFAHGSQTWSYRLNPRQKCCEISLWTQARGDPVQGLLVGEGGWNPESGPLKPKPSS